MNVEEFVKENLTQIANAANSVRDTSKGQYVDADVTVHFDIAVAATEATDIEGGAKLQVASLVKVGGDAKKEKSIQEYSRVSFDLFYHLYNY